MSISLHADKNWPYQVNSGALVYRIREGAREYALLIRRNSALDKHPETYNISKGRVDDGETLEQAAAREAAEETGFEVELKAYLGALHGDFTNAAIGYRIHRALHYYLARFDSVLEHGMDEEHDEVVWLSAEEAKQKLAMSPKGEEEIVERAEEWFKTLNNESA